jgi:hypothetical protein
MKGFSRISLALNPSYDCSAFNMAFVGYLDGADDNDEDIRLDRYPGHAGHSGFPIRAK